MHLAHAAKKFGTCSFSSIVPNPKTDTPEGVVSIPRNDIEKICHVFYFRK